MNKEVVKVVKYIDQINEILKNRNNDIFNKIIQNQSLTKNQNSSKKIKQYKKFCQEKDKSDGNLNSPIILDKSDNAVQISKKNQQNYISARSAIKSKEPDQKFNMQLLKNRYKNQDESEAIF